MKKIICLLLAFSIMVLSPLTAFAGSTQGAFPEIGENELNLKSSVEYTEGGFIERGSFVLDGENFTYVQVSNQEGTIISIIGDKGTVEEIVVDHASVEMDYNQLSDVGVMMDPHVFNYSGSTFWGDLKDASVFVISSFILNSAIVRHYPGYGLYTGLFSISLNIANFVHSYHKDIFKSYYEKEVIREFWPDDGSLSPYREVVTVTYWRNPDFSGHIRTAGTIIHPIMDK